MNRLEQIRELLDKYEQQDCNAEEIQQLHEWLEEQALAGKPWEFRDPADREIVKNKMLHAISTGMETASASMETASAGMYTTSAGMDATELDTTELAVKTATYEKPQILQQAAGILKWVRYAAVAAAVASVVWGISMLSRSSEEVIVASAPGKIEKVNLPDGSTVWLNDNTELRYHRDFATNRSIELKRGEAFFDVKKDPEHLFTVRSGDLHTSVLGTSFSARMNGITGGLRVSVVTGKVMVSRQKDTLGVVLPGQRFKYVKSPGKTMLDSAQAEEANGWIHGDILLQNVSMEEVTQWLQDHFGVNIQNKQSTYRGVYYLQAKSDIPLPEVLKILNLLGKKEQVQFSLQGHTIIIQ